LINCYAVPEGEEQKSKLRIRAAAGLDSVVTIGTSGGVRGMIEVDGVVYCVVGRSIYQVDSGGNAVLVGGLPSDGFVGMARNQRSTGVQTAVVCDGIARSIVGGSMSAITLPISAIDVCVINRSAIYVSSDGRMVRSEVDDLTDVDALDQARAEASPDRLLRGVDRGSDLIAIGERSTEVWQDQGAEAFGFARANVINIGSVGASAIVKGTVLGQTVSDTVAWCANNDQGRYAGVVMLNGYTPTKISTAFVDRKVDAVSDKTGIVASSWVERGRAFLAWRLEDTTIVYDTSTGQWHERKSRDSVGDPTAWHVGRTTVLGGRVIGGHVTSPKLYWVDPDVFDDDGDEMIMVVQAPPLSGFPGRIEVNRLWLDMVPGVGLNGVSGGVSYLTNDADEILTNDAGVPLTMDETPAINPNVDPEVVLELSRDGETWGNARHAPLGRQGQTMTRVFWNRCGTHATVTPRFSCSAAVVREILQASWEGTSLPP